MRCGSRSSVATRVGPAGLQAISLSLVMLGLIDSAALAPLAAVAVAFPGAGIAARAALAVVAAAGVTAAAVIVALPRLAEKQTLPALPAWPLVEPAHDVFAARDPGVGVRLRLLARPRSGVVRPPRHDRTGLLVPTRASVSLRGCRSRGAANRASGRGHPGGRRNRRPRRRGCREPRRPSLPPSLSVRSESSPGQPSCFSPLPGAPAGCCCRREPQPDQAALRISRQAQRIDGPGELRATARYQQA
jgi:hypothetical protein